MKKVLSKIIVWPLMLIFVAVEQVLRVMVKISTVAAGLFINVLLICMLVAIFTQQWVSLGILFLFMVIVSLFIFGHATILYFIGEARESIKNLK